MAWNQFAAQGVFLSSHPHSSFFYMLTGVHLAHLAGGLVWFAAAFTRLRRLAYAPGRRRPGPVRDLLAYLLLLYVL